MNIVIYTSEYLNARPTWQRLWGVDVRAWMGINIRVARCVQGNSAWPLRILQL